MQKFNSGEWVDVPTCNLAKIVHNIWLQQLRNLGICLYTLMFNNYVRAFK
jgi:hypothetical protein